MLFNSYLFLCLFLPLVLGGFALAGRFGRRAALCWLLGASMLFYGWWAPAFVPLLLASIAINFAIADLIRRTQNRPRQQAWLTAGGIVANLALLGGCKALAPVLPPGISFFTFTQIGFLLDSQAETGPRRSLLDYALFVAAFPHVIAGPIPTGRELLPQFARPGIGRLSAENLAIGGGIFVIGLLKKTLLADPMGPIVAQGFGAPASLTLLAAWHAALAWSLQLYFDFSGYSDMAIGLGRMLNLRYPLNFASPYKAQSIIDYWQRWHMTLTRFLMHRLYSPLTLLVLRQRQSRGWPVDRAAQRRFGGFVTMLALPLLATMALAGIWHGSGWSFLLFGLLHGLFLSVNHAWRLRYPGRRSATVTAVVGRVALTYLCVLVGAVVFRAPSVTASLSMLAAMTGWHGVVLSAPDPRSLYHAVLDLLWLGALFAIVWCAPNTQQIMDAVATRSGSARLRWRQSTPWAVAFGCAATLGLLSIGGTGEFVYFRF